MSHFVHPRAVAAPGLRSSRIKWIAAVILVSVCAAIAVALIVADDDGGSSSGGSATPTSQPSTFAPPTETRDVPGAVRYDGGPDEGSRGVTPVDVEPITRSPRYDGGPEEGTRGPGR